jgi:hypothetical protein
MNSQDYREIIRSQHIPDSLVTERVEVFGVLRGGSRFSLPVTVKYDPTRQKVEEAIIKAMESQARDFNELCIEMRWEYANWTYPSRGRVVANKSENALSNADNQYKTKQLKFLRVLNL